MGIVMGMGCEKTVSTTYRRYGIFQAGSATIGVVMKYHLGKSLDQLAVILTQRG